MFQGRDNDQQIKTVNARDLHGYLRVGEKFSEWIKARIKKYGFVENQDVTLISQNGEIKTTGRGGDRRSNDYHISIDMAKELSMVERNQKGKGGKVHQRLKRYPI